MSSNHIDKVTQDKSKHKQAEQQQAESLHKPFRLEDADVMDLQRTIGNQSVQSVMGRPTVQRKADVGLPSLPGVVQTKMEVNEPGDQYEVEADNVAHEVMTMPDPVQREEEMPEEEMMLKRIQREEMPEEEMMMKPIQREETPDVSSTAESQIEGSRGSGAALPDDTRSFLEPRFGQDFSDVRIHTGAESHELNDQLQARAFTTGSDIYFRDGEYNPNSDAGKELLAHELTHVVQQGGGGDLQTKHDEEGCC
jgi:hypothetical protein